MSAAADELAEKKLKELQTVYGIYSAEFFVYDVMQIIKEHDKALLTSIKEEMKQHTVPEGPGLITRSYLNNTIDFKINALLPSGGVEGETE